MIKALFNLIVKVYENRQFKSSSAVAMNIADALISEDQSDMKVELSKVLRSVIRVLTGSIEESTMGLSSNRSTNALSQMQMAYANNKGNDRPRNNSSMRSRKSSPNTAIAIPDITDEMRVTMARDISTQLNSDLRLPNF